MWGKMSPLKNDSPLIGTRGGGRFLKILNASNDFWAKWAL